MFMTMMMTNSGNDGVLVMTECKVTDKIDQWRRKIANREEILRGAMAKSA